jgi:ribosomal protein S18 acetylase RimI-like enzyme
MSVTLRALLASEFAPWFLRSCAEYAQDLMTQGRSSADAKRLADESMIEFFPNRAPEPGHGVFHVVTDSGQTVGYLWIGPDLSADPSAWWVWDIVIDADQRGRGFGRAAMLLGEEFARSQGAVSLGLSVFGFNAQARALYESLGYETTSVKMRKLLA